MPPVCCIVPPPFSLIVALCCECTLYIDMFWYSNNWWFQPLLKNISQLGISFPKHRQIEHVPNHQPEHRLTCWKKNISFDDVPRKPSRNWTPYAMKARGQFVWPCRSWVQGFRHQIPMMFHWTDRKLNHGYGSNTGWWLNPTPLYDFVKKGMIWWNSQLSVESHKIHVPVTIYQL